MSRSRARRWVQLPNAVHFCMQCSEESDQDSDNHHSKTSKKTMSYHFRCCEPDGDDRIEACIQEAFQW